jgi:hypothetical protein
MQHYFRWDFILRLVFEIVIAMNALFAVLQRLNNPHAPLEKLWHLQCNHKELTIINLGKVVLA